MLEYFSLKNYKIVVDLNLQHPDDVIFSVYTIGIRDLLRLSSLNIRDMIKSDSKIRFNNKNEKLIKEEER